MLAEIASVAATLKSLGEMAKTVKDLSAAAALEAKIGELFGQVTAARESALASQTREAALLQRVRQLESEKLELEAWAAEKQRYQLADFGGGTFAQTLKPGMEQGEPFHRLCNSCFQQRRKGFLHSGGDFHGREKVKCDACDKTFMLGVSRLSSQTRARGTDFDPFTGR